MNRGIWLVIMSLIMLMGFVFGVNQTDAQTGGCSTTHTVQRGETLYRIALLYGTTVADLQARNNITNPNQIYAGQQLCVSGGFVPTATPAPDGGYPPIDNGSVTAWFLNVRSGPGTNYGVIRVVIWGTSFPVSGRNADTSWYQVILDSFTNNKGWVSAAYFNVSNPQSLPVISDSITQQPYSANVTLIQDASLHIAPAGNQGINPQTVFAGMTVRVIGRNQAATWFQISTDDGTAWVRRDVFPAEFPATLFPVTG